MFVVKYLGKTIELTDAEYEQIMKCPNYKYKTKYGDIVKGLDSTVTAKVCKASDPTLNLTKNDFDPLNPPVYYVTDDKQLQQMCACTTIDYAMIGSGAGCPTCRQETLDACQLESISGKDPLMGGSLSITGPAPHITSLRGLARLNGNLSGSLNMGQMDELTTLEGLGNITRIGQNMIGHSIELINNPKLASAMALDGSAIRPFTSTALTIWNNPQLACVPEHWSDMDSQGNTVRNGKALHDPCRYQCDSITSTCSQTADGNLSLTDCSSNCSKLLN